MGAVDPGTYALVGASASLAGMARITISLSVILVEATGNTQWVLPILFTVTTAKWVGDFFNKGIYDVHIDLKHVPVLEQFPEHGMRHKRVTEVMIQDVVVLDKVVVVRELLDLLSNCGHHGFPVVHPPESDRFFGMVTRDLILRLLW